MYLQFLRSELLAPKHQGGFRPNDSHRNHLMAIIHFIFSSIDANPSEAYLEPS